MKYNIYLCASVYPDPSDTTGRIGIDVTPNIDGFVKAIGRNELLPFFGAYQRLVYSYFFYKKLVQKHPVDFVFVTGGSSIIPKAMASKTIVYVHYPEDAQITSQQYLKGRKTKKFYILPWLFISKNIDFIKNCTILTNSKFTKDTIQSMWGVEATVIYPPCPQYGFNSEESSSKRDIVCCLGRFTPGKEYEKIIKVAARLPRIKFELVGSVTIDKISYLEKLKATAGPNITFHVNSSVAHKVQILKRSKVLFHASLGEHFGIALVEAMSSGVIPITHNSGAAKIDELVPQRFRYNDEEEAVQLITDAISSWNPSDASKLAESVEKFSPECFRQNIKSFISGWVKSLKT
jgi:glycosyltransferase involved in cell wall biosynthesis